MKVPPHVWVMLSVLFVFNSAGVPAFVDHAPMTLPDVDVLRPWSPRQSLFDENNLPVSATPLMDTPVGLVVGL